MVINSVQYGMKQSIGGLLAHLKASVELLAENKFAITPGIETALSSSRSRWQRLDALISIPWKESQACS